MVTAIMEVTEERVFPVLVTFGILFPISLLTLGVGLFRTGVTPKWVAALLGIGAILFPLGHIGSMQIVTHVAETLLLIPMLWIGWHYLAQTKPSRSAVPATT
jgi:hypothetical protein